MRRGRLMVFGLVMAMVMTTLSLESHVADAQERPPARDRAGRDRDEVFVKWGGSGANPRPTAGSDAADDPCKYTRGNPSLPTGGESLFEFVDHNGVVWVFIYWQCNLPDTTVDGSGLFQVGESSIQELVDAVYDSQPWPALEIITGPNDVVVSGLPIGLRLEGETYEHQPTARGDDGTLWVRATATATEVQWRMGGINSQFGGNDLIDCWNFGNRTPDPADSICNYTYASSSATTGGSVDLQAGILYTIEYTTNLPALAAHVVRFGRPTFRHVILRPGYVVSEAQSVIVE